MLLPQQTSGTVRGIVLSKQAIAGVYPSLMKNPRQERSCKSACSDRYDILSDAYSTCYNFCECLWKTDNSVWRCIRQAVTDQVATL